MIECSKCISRSSYLPIHLEWNEGYIIASRNFIAARVLILLAIKLAPPFHCNPHLLSPHGLSAFEVEKI